MATRSAAMSFTEEAEVRMQELAEFLAKDTRVNLALTSQLHDNGVLLTPGAFLMLAIPLLESGRLGDPPEATRDSVSKLLDAMKTTPAPADAQLDESAVRNIVVGRKPGLLRPRPRPVELGPRENVRSSLSVLEAYRRDR